ncbi:MAG: PLP-dependent aminotransferase family protein [Chloroflexi bacterium]|nr:PLP-dependent aminotransferase family protein [Chloroflexota bacterium]MCC6891933.1 PLP-dependent aminotransferase family protein [Anaerolineae bacterium]
MLNPSKLAIGLEREGEEPIYRQLIRHIRAQIESGTLAAGTRLPASRDLAQQLNISRISVVNAYAELRAEGFLSAHAGRGTFIAGDANNSTAPADHPNGHVKTSTPEAPTTPDRSLREMMRMARKPGIISFAQGAPPGDFFPMQHLRDAINTVLDRDGAKAMSYEIAEGYAPLRSAVRDYVSGLGIHCSPDQVLITGGTQQACDMVVQALLSEGDMMITENPTYLGMIDIARTRRVQVHGVDVDEQGIRLDMLENFILDNRPKLIYVMPTFQNPTGSVMPLHRRRQLLNLANHYQIPVLEDGVYHELRFEGESLPPLKALDDTGIVIHASGFTKMMLPGLRIGYIITNNHHYERLVRVKQAADISTPSLNQRTMHLMIQRGVLAQQLERNNRELKRRRDVAIAAATKHLPPGSRWNVPEGGLYLWVNLPKSGPTSAEVYITALQMGAAYAIGSVFYTNSCGSHRMRINFGSQKPPEIEDGLKRIGRAWREVACDYEAMEKSPLL